MSKDLKFHDNTILSTPNPIHTSSFTGDVMKKHPLDLLQDIPEKDDSLGLVSLKSNDDFPLRSSDIAAQLRKERGKARSSLHTFDLKHGKLMGIPSQFLNKCSLTDSASAFQLGHESTISEADLLPNSSTPRESILEERASTSHMLNDMVRSLRNPSCDISDVMSKMQHSINLEDGSFQSGLDAMAQLEKDERSWRNQKDIPAQMRDFSFEPYMDNVHMSMGGFFQQRSDDPSDLFKTPAKTVVPQITEVSVNHSKVTQENKKTKKTLSPQQPFNYNPYSNVTKDSIALDDIQKMLSSDHSTTNLMQQLLKPKATSKPRRKSPIPEIPNEVTVPDNLSVHEIKENISPDVQPDKSISSIRSSSSLSSLPNGKLPITSTKSEIVWGCIKPGKCSTKEFVIKNKSSGRLGLNCTVQNPAFRINKDSTEFTSSLKLVLHAYESKTLMVTFAPSSSGAAVDNINFLPIDPNHKQLTKQFINLSGYGGIGNLIFQNIIKDFSGKFLLPLGNIDNDLKLKKEFLIKNSGSLPVFAHFKYIVSGLPALASLDITPKIAVLLPDEERQITVKYSLQKKDLKYVKSKMMSCVEDVGKIHVCYGTEVDRCRLRKICQKAKEKKQQIPSYLEELIAPFPGEVVPSDLKIFRDKISALDEVQKFINNREITVTVEHDVDATITQSFQDDTAMFRSLNEDSLDTLDNTLCKEMFVVEPSNIILTPPDKTKDRIILTNNSSKTSYFEVSSAPEGLKVKPEQGLVKAGETFIIDLECTRKLTDKTVFKVRILVDNEKFDVDVKVVFVTKSSR